MSKNLSSTAFIFSQILILVIGLVLIGWLYFFLQEQSGGKDQSLMSKPVTALPVSLTLDLSSPEDDLLSFKDEVLVSGQTQEGLGILISSQDHDIVIKADSAGNFSVDFPLELGVNHITVAVFDETGDSRTAEKSVYYSKEKI